ncbi:hypothetical protein ACH3XW_43505 [Acanthocheilonema viteae]
MSAFSTSLLPYRSVRCKGKIESLRDKLCMFGNGCAKSKLWYCHEDGEYIEVRSVVFSVKNPKYAIQLFVALDGSKCYYFESRGSYTEKGKKSSIPVRNTTILQANKQLIFIVVSQLRFSLNQK